MSTPPPSVTPLRAIQVLMVNPSLKETIALSLAIDEQRD